MLISFIMNTMDTFNIIYLWEVLNSKSRNIPKLLFSVFILSSVITISEDMKGNFIFVYIIDIIVIKIIYKKNLKHVVFGLLLTMLIGILLQLMLGLIINTFVSNYIIQGFIIESIIMVSLIIFSKVKSLNKYVMRNYPKFENINSNILIYFILTSSIYILVFKFLWNADNSIIKSNLLVTVGIISMLIIGQIFTYLYVAKVIKEKEKLKVSNEYNSVIEEIVEEIKQRQHDFINYKNTIRGIINVVDEKDVKEAIYNYIEDEDVYDTKINELIYIDNVVIRSIIYRNMCKSKKYNINFEYEIANNVLDDILSYHEISNILNNLLNNAFEEILKEECIEKNIKIKIFNQNKTSHLIITNQVSDPNNINLNEMFTRGYSNKDTGTRGYGLYNVQAIINYHKGNIKINVECGEIIFDIYFNNSSG